MSIMFAEESQASNLLISDLDNSSVTSDTLVQLFGVYGDVMRVTMLRYTKLNHFVFSDAIALFSHTQTNRKSICANGYQGPNKGVCNY